MPGDDYLEAERALFAAVAEAHVSDPDAYYPRMEKVWRRAAIWSSIRR